jgi:hypothetical protein
MPSSHIRASGATRGAEAESTSTSGFLAKPYICVLLWCNLSHLPDVLLVPGLCSGDTPSQPMLSKRFALAQVFSERH